LKILKESATQSWELRRVDWATPVDHVTETTLSVSTDLAMTSTTVLRSITTWKLPGEQERPCASIRGTRNTSD